MYHDCTIRNQPDRPAHQSNIATLGWKLLVICTLLLRLLLLPLLLLVLATILVIAAALLRSTLVAAREDCSFRVVVIQAHLVAVDQDAPLTHSHRIPLASRGAP